MERTIAGMTRIYINGGRRGYLVGLDPADLIRVLKPTPVDAAAAPARCSSRGRSRISSPDRESDSRTTAGTY